MKIIKFIALIIVWVLAVYGVRQVGRIYDADRYSVLASYNMEKGEYSEAMKYADLSIKLNPNEPSYYRVRALAYLAFNVLEKNPAYKEKAQKDVLSAISLNPDNLVTKRNFVPIMYFLAGKDYDDGSCCVDRDSKYFKDTEEYFQNLKNDYPQDAGIISLVAEYEKKLKMEEEYTESVEIIRKLRPDLLEWYRSFN